MKASQAARRTWDLVVVGGGTAGLVASKTAARLGARVLLIERGKPGGDCLWTGCVPSKALLAAAHSAAQARNAHPLGVHVGDVRVDFTAVMQHVHDAVAHIEPEDSSATLERHGVRTLKGDAQFVSPHQVRVAGRRITFRQALIATGATPSVPQLEGLEDGPYLTSDTVWNLAELPTSLVVVGGGSIGCELAQAFARLGSRVTLVEEETRVLPREDAVASELVLAALVADGVTVHTGRRIAALKHAPGTVTAHLLGGGTASARAVLLAVGRTPRTRGLGLERAGVAVLPGGWVQVDERLRTAHPRIWAAGDVTGHPQFTHTAGMHGSWAATQAVVGVGKAVSLEAMPRVTFTQPEVAAVGVSTQRPPRGVRVVEWPHSRVDRAVAEGATDGVTRVAVDGRGRIRGATVVGERAGEVLAELTLAVQQGLSTADLAFTTHPYPTYGDGPWNAAISHVEGQVTSPPMSWAVAAARRVRRWWLWRDDRAAAVREQNL